MEAARHIKTWRKRRSNRGNSMCKGFEGGMNLNVWGTTPYWLISFGQINTFLWALFFSSLLEMTITLSLQDLANGKHSVNAEKMTLTPLFVHFAHCSASCLNRPSGQFSIPGVIAPFYKLKKQTNKKSKLHLLKGLTQSSCPGAKSSSARASGFASLSLIWQSGFAPWIFAVLTCLSPDAGH